jgi:hypothetical protein
MDLSVPNVGVGIDSGSKLGPTDLTQYVPLRKNLGLKFAFKRGWFCTI